LEVRIVRKLLSTAVTLLLAVAVGAPSLAATAWDQAQVSALAKQLAAETSALRDIAEKNPDKPPGSARKAQYAVREDLRLLASATKRLAKRLAGGAGRDETEGLYKRAASLRRDADEQAKNQDVLANARAQADKTLALFDQLAAYYQD
jgi:hypothetical protein